MNRFRISIATMLTGVALMLGFVSVISAEPKGAVPADKQAAKTKCDNAYLKGVAICARSSSGALQACVDKCVEKWTTCIKTAGITGTVEPPESADVPHAGRKPDLH